MMKLGHILQALIASQNLRDSAHRWRSAGTVRGVEAGWGPAQATASSGVPARDHAAQQQQLRARLPGKQGQAPCTARLPGRPVVSRPCCAWQACTSRWRPSAGIHEPCTAISAADAMCTCSGQRCRTGVRRIIGSGQPSHLNLPRGSACSRRPSSGVRVVRLAPPVPARSMLRRAIESSIEGYTR